MSKRRRQSHDPYVSPRGIAQEGAGVSRRRVLLWLGVGGAGVGGLGVLTLASRPNRAPVAPVAPADLDLDTVTVDRPAIDLGRVKLDVEVPVSVTLTNQSRRQVILRQATVEALEGC